MAISALTRVVTVKAVAEAPSIVDTSASMIGWTSPDGARRPLGEALQRRADVGRVEHQPGEGSEGQRGRREGQRDEVRQPPGGEGGPRAGVLQAQSRAPRHQCLHPLPHGTIQPDAAPAGRPRLAGSLLRPEPP